MAKGLIGRKSHGFWFFILFCLGFAKRFLDVG
jgi:hypothetical protein